MKNLIYIILCLFLLSPSISIAWVDPCPVATDENIYGVWEAVDLDTVYRVFRLEINKTGASVLSEGLPHGNNFSFYLTNRSQKDGKIKFQFQTDNPGLVGVTYIVNEIEYTSKGHVLIEGTARVCSSTEGDSGTMEVTLTMEPDSPNPTKWELVFYKLPTQTLVDNIVEMEKLAEDSANKLKTRLEKQKF